MTPRWLEPANAEPAVSFFAFDRLLRADGPLEERIGACLSRALEFFDRYPWPASIAAVSRLLGLAPRDAERLRGEVAAVGHVGLLVPPEAGAETIGRAAGAAGLALVRAFPSAVLARELGALSGRPLVETTIFTLARTGSERPAGVELFVPATGAGEADRWIAEGLGTHVGFRAVSRAAVSRIQRILAPACATLVPSFMGGRPMDNPTTGSIVLYYDLATGPGPAKLRVEFYHEPAGE